MTEELKHDPRYVEREIAGRVYGFFFGPYGIRLAKRHGVDAVKMELDAGELEQAMQVLWVAHLPFAPDLTLDAFEMRFALADMGALAEAAAEVMRLQMGVEPEAETKPRANGRAKKKRASARQT